METVYICRCNNCFTKLIDKNPSEKSIAVPLLSEYKEMKYVGDCVEDKRDAGWVCPVCDTDGFLTDVTVKFMWSELGDVLVNNNDEIERDFYFWKKGTNKIELWLWFDEMIPGGLGKFLYRQKPKNPLVKIIFGEIEFVDDTANVLNNVLELWVERNKADLFASDFINHNPIFKTKNTEIELSSYVIPELYPGTII